MPAPTANLVRKPAPAHITVALEPVAHLINSLLLLLKSEHLSGYGEWVTETAQTLSPAAVHSNRLVLLGFHYAVIPERSWPSFEAYLDHLDNIDPLALRTRMLAAYARMPGPERDQAQILSSAEAYLQYLYERFPAGAVEEAIEREAYALMLDPPAMRATIVNHLRAMWQTILKPEWERIRPMLQTSVLAFNQIDYSGLDLRGAVRAVVGQEIPERWSPLFDQPGDHQLVLVPSAHVGPYMALMKASRTIWLVFGARLPEGAPVTSLDLSRSELLVRLNALADDTRLRILQTLRDEGEMCSRDIIEALDLSQSAASRHLKQLSATGYLTERRQDGGKCYRLNEDRIEAILQVLSRFLLS